jgi:predicted metallopeptidase
LKVATRLIQVEDLIKLVNLTTLTGRVKNAKPISMLLIGDTETGKTQILEVFMNLKPVIWANDLSAKIIVDEVAPQVEKGKTHILIPDFLKILGHQKVVTRNTITMLNSIMEEGLKNVMFYGARKEFKHPVRCGVIAAMTKEAYRSREKHWKGIGFVGRCILVSYSYSDETKSRIHEHIRKGFPAKMIEITTGKRTQVEIPPKIAERVQDLATTGKRFSTGFRIHKHLRALVQAHALYRGDKKVKMEDFEEIKRLSKFMNLDFHQI